MIQAGVITIMSAHIAFPAWSRRAAVAGREAYRPASLSRELNEGLLRETVGFQGLIVSDATAMAGLTSWAEPAAPPAADNTDLVLYLFGQESTPTAAHIAVNWAKLHGGPRRAVLRFGREIPTLMVSFGHPYFFYDAPDGNLHQRVLHDRTGAGSHSKQTAGRAAYGRLPGGVHSAHWSRLNT